MLLELSEKQDFIWQKCQEPLSWVFKTKSVSRNSEGFDSLVSWTVALSHKLATLTNGSATLEAKYGQL